VAATMYKCPAKEFRLKGPTTSNPMPQKAKRLKWDETAPEDGE